jgi:uncharacterized cupin superfamily protein
VAKLSDRTPDHANHAEHSSNPEHNHHHILKAEQIDNLDELVKVHFLNQNAIRHYKPIGDLLGLQRLGISLVRIEPGRETTQFHFHHQEEEFLYIISGRGIAEIGSEVIEVAAGDFMAFTAPSAPHTMRNPFDQDLVYLMGGERRDFDVCDYPRLQKRLFRFDGDRQLVDWRDIQEFGTPKSQNAPE